MTFERAAFRHHHWATLRVLGACEGLTDDQLSTPVVGTFGGILETLRHLVASDTWYLFAISGGSEGRGRVDDGAMGLVELRAVAEEAGPGWERSLDTITHPDAAIVSERRNGEHLHATLDIRLAQVVHHGTDHRSQICTALTSLGITPPAIDVWDYGEQAGLVSIEP